MVRHLPPVATRGPEACVVFDGHGFAGDFACGDGALPVELILVDVAVFVGGAEAADGVGCFVWDFDEGGLFGFAEGEGEEVEEEEEEDVGDFHEWGTHCCGRMICDGLLVEVSVVLF